MKKFTAQQLKSYNGTNGNPAYIAYKGNVYDVSGVFKNGEHAGQKAGTDITAAFGKGPHKEDIFANFALVGQLVEDREILCKCLAAGTQRADLVLRLALGLIFLAHGSQKLLGWFGGFGWNGTMGYFTGTLHIPALLAGLVILIEFFGGLAVLIGLFTRIAALGITVTMLGAALTVHLANGFFLDKGGVEYVIALLSMSIYLLIKGSGAISVDALISKNCNR